MKLLYIEDSADAAADVSALLARQGSQVVWEKEGEAGLRRAAMEPFDAIILDRMLPDMDGVETLAGVRELKGGTETPVVFMTAKAQTHEQQQYLDLGALSVIVKPFDAFSLGDQLRSLWQAQAD